jgi:hypothetical protein
MIPTQVYIAHFICEQTFVPHFFFFFFFGKKKKKKKKKKIYQIKIVKGFKYWGV